MEPPSTGFAVLGLFSIVGLVLINGYFVATEFALVAVRRSQIKLWLAEGRPGARAADEAIGSLDDAIAATQLGITIASIGLGALGEPALAHLISPALEAAGVDHFVAVHGVAVFLAFSLVTFLHVVVGELAPKAVALDRPGEIALATARPLLIFSRVFRPVLNLMNGAGNLLVRGLGVRPAHHAEHAHSAKELQLLVQESRDAGTLRPYAARMMGNVIRISTRRVREVMVPRERIFAIPSDIGVEALLDRLSESGYTRLPVYDGTIDRVVGVLHTKDLFHLYAEKGTVEFSDAVRPHMEMPPGLSVSDALRRFRRQRQHLAIVRDPGEPVLGIVTLEDVLEEIVGQIEDEHDVDSEHMWPSDQLDASSADLRSTSSVLFPEQDTRPAPARPR